MKRNFLIIITILILFFQSILVYAQTKALSYFKDAQNAFEQKNFEVAINLYQEAIKIDPNFGEAYFGLGLVYSLNNQLKKSISFYKKAINIKPNFFQAYFALGLINFLQNNFIESVVYYEKALVLNPNEPEIYIGLGRVYSKLKKYNQAISYLLKAIPIQPENPDIYYALGLVYDAVEKGEKAINYIEKAKRLYKRDENILWQRHAKDKLKIYYKKYNLNENQNSHELFDIKNERPSKVSHTIKSFLEKKPDPLEKFPNRIEQEIPLVNMEIPERKHLRDSLQLQKKRESIEQLKYEIENKLARIDSWRDEKQEFEKNLLMESSKLQKERKSIENLKFQIDKKLSKTPFKWNQNSNIPSFIKNDELASIGTIKKSPNRRNNIIEDKLIKPALIQQQGKGFLFSLKNYVITSSQLIKKAQSIKIKLITGERMEADVLIDDAQNGIAILKPKKILLSYKPSLIIGNSSKLQIGEKVFAIGSIGSIPTYTEGFIKKLNGLEEDPTVFQYSMEAYPINSGAPIFNSKGEVIGITKKTIDLKLENKNLKNIPKIENYAVKSNYLSKLLTLLPKMKGSRHVSMLDSRSNHDVAKFLDDIKRTIVQIEVNKSS